MARCVDNISKRLFSKSNQNIGIYDNIRISEYIYISPRRATIHQVVRPGRARLVSHLLLGHMPEDMPKAKLMPRHISEHIADCMPEHVRVDAWVTGS